MTSARDIPGISTGVEHWFDVRVRPAAPGQFLPLATGSFRAYRSAMSAL